MMSKSSVKEDGVMLWKGLIWNEKRRSCWCLGNPSWRKHNMVTRFMENQSRNTKGIDITDYYTRICPAWHRSSYGKMRTAKEAYAKGEGFSNIFTMSNKSNGWTTLCPSPVAVFPDSPPGDRKGFGAIIFDSYMNDVKFPISESLYKTNGNCSISLLKWLDNGYVNKFAIGFEFNNENANGATMNAKASKCLSKESYGSGRGGIVMDGNGVSPNEDDKTWSF